MGAALDEGQVAVRRDCATFAGRSAPMLNPRRSITSRGGLGAAMVRPRRAKNRPARVLIPLVLLLGVAVALLGWRTNYTFDFASVLTPTAPTPTASTSTSTRPSTPAPTADRSERARKATNALRSCRTRVKAADTVIEAADTGIGNWSEHVEAQTKANRDKITITMLDKVFDRTRDAGPEDQKRYSKARENYREAKGACEPVAAAPKDVAAALANCQERVEAQERVMRAAEPAMADWKSHLEQMKQSDKHPGRDAQEAWLKAWQAAPPNINAFTKAVEDFEDDAPRCMGPK